MAMHGLRGRFISVNMYMGHRPIPVYTVHIYIRIMFSGFLSQWDSRCTLFHWNLGDVSDGCGCLYCSWISLRQCTNSKYILYSYNYKNPMLILISYI